MTTRLVSAIGLTTFLLAAGVSATAAAETDLLLRLAYGYDSNPERLPDGGDTGGFTELSLDTDIDLRTRKSTQFFVEAFGTKRMYEGDTSEADTSRAGLAAGVVFLPKVHGRRRFAVVVGADRSIYRSTYVDPRTGDVYEYAEGLPGGGFVTTPIPNRFDFNSNKAFVNVRWALNRRVRLSLDTRLENLDYLEEYETITGLESLDYRSLTVEPGVRVRLGDLATLSIALSSTDREYDEQSALDINGNDVAQTPREYRYRGYRMRLSLAPTRSLGIRFGVRRTDREDLYAGYYNSDSESAYLRLDKRLGKKNRLSLFASQAFLDYDNATIANDPNGEIRGGDVLTTFGRFERRLPRGLTLFTEFGVQRADNQDPIFTYDRDWAMTGFQFKR